MSENDKYNYNFILSIGVWFCDYVYQVSGSRVSVWHTRKKRLKKSQLRA